MEGIVDLDDEHIRITYGDVRKNEEIILVAFITPTVKGKKTDSQFNSWIYRI